MNTPRTDAKALAGPYIAVQGEVNSQELVDANFARTLELEVAELSERLIERQESLVTVLAEKARLQRELSAENAKLRQQVESLQAAQEEMVEQSMGG